MLDTIRRLVQSMPAGAPRAQLQTMFTALGDRASTQVLSSAGLAIKAGASALVKAGSLFYASVQGVIVKVAANTDQAALVGTVTNAKFNVFCFFLDKAGTGTSAMGTEGASLATVKWPPIPPGKALVGFVIINPTGTGNFVGGTTALDDGTVVPNAAYVNCIGAFDPTILVE